MAQPILRSTSASNYIDLSEFAKVSSEMGTTYTVIDDNTNLEILSSISQFGVTYVIIDISTNKAPKGLGFYRQGESLLIEQNHKIVLGIQYFFFNQNNIVKFAVDSKQGKSENIITAETAITFEDSRGHVMASESVLALVPELSPIKPIVLADVPAEPVSEVVEEEGGFSWFWLAGAGVGMIGIVVLVNEADSQDSSGLIVRITDDTLGTATGPVTYTFTFSKKVWGFEVNDIIVIGGTKDEFKSLDETTYTLVVTPPAGSTTAIKVNVNANVATDAAGNYNMVAVRSVQAVNMDTVKPTLVITDDEPGVAKGPVTYTFTFSEKVTGFTTNDINVIGGDRGPLIKLNDITYTLVVTPPAGSTTSIIVDVSVDVAINNTVPPPVQRVDTLTYTADVNTGATKEMAGNDNSAAVQSVQSVNTVVDTAIVVFDLTTGKSSSHSNRMFSKETTDIYFIVEPKDYHLVLNEGNKWSAADDVSPNIYIHLVSSVPGENIFGNIGSDPAVLYKTVNATAFKLTGAWGKAFRTNSQKISSVSIWDVKMLSFGGADYLTKMPPGILTTQGLI